MFVNILKLILSSYSGFIDVFLPSFIEILGRWCFERKKSYFFYAVINDKLDLQNIRYLSGIIIFFFLLHKILPVNPSEDTSTY